MLELDPLRNPQTTSYEVMWYTGKPINIPSQIRVYHLRPAGNEAYLCSPRAETPLEAVLNLIRTTLQTEPHPHIPSGNLT